MSLIISTFNVLYTIVRSGCLNVLIAQGKQKLLCHMLKPKTQELKGRRLEYMACLWLLVVCRQRELGKLKQ